MKFTHALLALLAAAIAADASTVSAALRGVLFPKMRQQHVQLASTAQSVEATAAAPAADEAQDDSTDAASDDETAAAAPQTAAAAAPAEAADMAVTLPTVQSLAGTAAERMKKLHSQASILEARIAQSQMENEAKLTRQKAIFEEKLKAQEESNHEVMDVNANISAQIKKLKNGNANLRKKAKDLQEGNRLKQSELQTLKSKLQLAESFISESMQVTDDEHAKDLNVLQSTASVSKKGTKLSKPAAKPAMFRGVKNAASASKHKAAKKKKSEDEDKDETTTDDEAEDDQQDEDQQDDGDDQDDQDEEDAADTPHSFMALSSRVHRVRVSQETGELGDVETAIASGAVQPSDLLAVLTTGVQNLAKEEKASDARLKNMFMTNFKKGTKKHSSLLEEQKALKTERANLQALQTKLQAAVDHLENTRANLKERLRGLGLFLQRLGHLAVSPSGEAQRLIKSLPEKITPQKAPAGSPAPAVK
eukprot:TRINITY_DN101235_c0_g1_i1.p1 TRINITY_DN101235_c0_g1~~TRINITY_DN101235_c0_g1_i1.p1  ORF type:complete len:478 (+),score=203.00 TRINITY_DN101235_c0_g1_i1:62-1495(+)